MNVYDYIDYYKNVKFEDVALNKVDMLIFAILAYSPIESFKSKSFDSFIEDNIANKKVLYYNPIIPIVKDVCKKLAGTTRYKDIKFVNYSNFNNEKTQFGAISVKVGKTKVICFEGTDGSSIGWLENFRCMYEYPTFTQKLATDYLKSNITEDDEEVYVTGHSKGGNMAMASAMEMDDKEFNKIKRVINFDGPGFRRSEYSSYKYKRLSEKLDNIIPSGSIVGTLLYNNKYSVIKSSGTGVGEHYPTSWIIFGQFFVKDKITAFSKSIHTKTTTGLKNINMDNAKYAIELIFEEIRKKKNNLYDITASDLVDIYKNVKNMDSNTFDYIFSLVSSTLFNKKL